MPHVFFCVVNAPLSSTGSVWQLGKAYTMGDRVCGEVHQICEGAIGDWGQLCKTNKVSSHTNRFCSGFQHRLKECRTTYTCLNSVKWASTAINTAFINCVFYFHIAGSIYSDKVKLSHLYLQCLEKALPRSVLHTLLTYTHFCYPYLAHLSPLSSHPGSCPHIQDLIYQSTVFTRQ